MARGRHLRLLLAFTLAWAVWTVWFLLTGERDVSLAVVDEQGLPVAGVVVSAEGEDLGVTDASGVARVEWRRDRKAFLLAAPGFAPRRLVIEDPPPSRMEARIDSRVLRGLVVDPEGRPVSEVRVSAGYGDAMTGGDGTFLVRLAEPGPVLVERPGWEGATLAWDGSPGEQVVEVEPRVVKAFHVTGEVAGDPEGWSSVLSLVERSELNGVMLDLKDERGIVSYDSEVETARRVGAVVPHYDLAEVARLLDDRDVYLIGRIVVFQDPRAALARPEMAVGDGAGGLFRKGRHVFLDPTDEEARRYGLDLAEEACRLGVDEVQLDYIRYPDGFQEGAVFDGPSDQDGRVEAIRSFLEETRDVVGRGGCALGGDVFGFTTTASDDGGIGQQWEVVSESLDIVSPMLYPSHYSSGWFGLDNPNDHPAEVVRQALEDGMGRLESGTVVRPWLQDFGYGPEQVRAQIEVAEEHGLGWMLWNAESRVTSDALAPSEEQGT